MKISIFTLYLLFAITSSFSQISGKLYFKENGKREPISGAVIRCKQERCSQLSSTEGFFTINHFITNDTIILKAFGFFNDTLFLTVADNNSVIEIELFAESTDIEVVVSSRQNDTGISKLKVLQTQILNSGELRKAACCNISESFETNASVDVSLTDAVTGAKRIQLMGLDGIYTQLQFENIPFLRGIESSFGMSAIPGPWVESIQITKGVGNVVNGFESMAGLVNFEMKKPQKMDKAHFNAYIGAFGRAEINVLANEIHSPKWSSATMMHGSGSQVQIDLNKDGFRDLPLTQNASILQRFAYSGKKFESQFGVTAYYEDKQGGQLSKYGNGRYRADFTSKHVEAFGKTGFMFEKYRKSSIGVIYNAKMHQTLGQIGNHQYDGKEARAYMNGIFQHGDETDIHSFKTGLSGVAIRFIQKVDGVFKNRTELIPGVFGEYTLHLNRLTTIFGTRADYHNLFGWQVSPRVHGIFRLTEKLDLRYSAGKGFRVPNVYVDQLALRTTSRTWNVDPIIKPEISWNGGGSLVYDFKIAQRKITLVSDYYYTWFENQLMPDFDLNYLTVNFVNHNRSSFSHAFQTELSTEILRGLEIRLVYKYLNVQMPSGGKVQQQAFTPNHRGMFNTLYRTRNKKWNFDATVQYYGKMRLPVARLDATNFTQDNFSKDYIRLNAQITYIRKRWEFYLGGENLTNFRQLNPIIDAANPFGPFFDATRVWGPILGIHGYAGVRFTIKHDQK